MSLDLSAATEWAASQGVAAEDQPRFLLAAGLLAGLGDPGLSLVGALDPVAGRNGYTFNPIRIWRDPRSTDLRPPAAEDVRSLAIPRSGVRVSFEPGTATDLISHIEEWLRPLTEPAALSVGEEPRPTLRPWGFPVRLGIAAEYRQPLLDTAGQWLEPLVVFVDPHRRRSSPQLIIGTDDWVRSWVSDTTSSAGAVLVLGAAPPHPLEESGADGRVGARIYLPMSTDVVRITGGLLYHLSHNRSLDEAVRLAAEDQPATLLANPAYLDRTRIIDAIGMASDRQKRARPMGSFDWDGGRIRRAAPDARRSGGLPDVDDSPDILDRFRNRPFDHETHDATDAATLIRDIEERTAGREHRFLTAEASPADRVADELTATLEVWVAPLRLAGSAVAPERLADEAFDWSTGAVELDVVLFELRDGGFAGRHTITLPATGASDKARFDLHWSAGGFEARVAVLHEHRFVQTMLLTIADDGTSVGFEAECVVRPADFELNELQPHRAAIVMNDHDGPKLAVATAVGEMIRAPEGLDELRRSMTNLLLRIIDEPEDYDSIDSPAFSTLLIDLALRGVTLRDVLFTGDVTAVAPAIYEELRAADRISILSAEPTKIVPLEFVYDPDFSPPFGETGSVCETAVEAMRAEGDLAELLPGCSHVSDTGTCGADETKMCPLGFWGFRKIIERHAKRPEAAPVEMDFSLGASPTADRSTLRVSRILASATPKADANPTAAWSEAKTAIGSRLADRFESVDGWMPIVEDFEDTTTRRDLLLLLPHVDKDDDGQLILDLGVEPSMGVHQIRAALKLKTDRPLVFLLGCATGPSDTPTEEFPGRFLDAGAAVVLATMTLVRGRFVSVLGRQLIDLMIDLAEGAEEPLFGEALLMLRQKLLSRNPLVLTLIAYGDADWVLGPGADL